MRSETITRESSASALQVGRELFLRAFLGGVSGGNAGASARRLASRVSDLWLPEGKSLYEIGDPSEDHYFVVSGEIEIRGAAGESRRFGERSIVGLLDVSQERPRSRRAVATAASHLLRLSAQDWYDTLEDDFEFALGAIHGIGRGVFTSHLAHSGRFFNTLTTTTKPRKGALSFVERTLLLRAAPPFRKASVQAAVEVAGIARLVTRAAGEALFSAGDAKRSYYVVADGTVALVDDGRSIAEFHPGAVLGGLGALAAEPWPVMARAVNAATVVAVELEDLFDVMEEHFDLVRGALSELAREREQLATAGDEPPRPSP